MAKHKLEVKLSGEFTTIDIKVEGREVALREINDGEYYKKYSSFEIDDVINLNIFLIGFPTMEWKLEIFVDGDKVYSKKDKFIKDYVSYTENIERND